MFLVYDLHFFDTAGVEEPDRDLVRSEVTF